MASEFFFFKYAAKAVLACLPGGGLALDLVKDFLPEIADDLYGHWSQERRAVEMRDDLEAIVQTRADQIEGAVREAVAEEGAGLSDGEKADLEAYLRQIPATVQRTLRRPDDPHGQTVPNHLIPRGMEDVMRLLPDRVPRFREGDPVPDRPDWKLVRPLGAGGFGEVWLAENPFVGQAAIKFCLDGAAARQLRNEAELLGRVKREGTHPGFVQLQDTSLNGEVSWLQYEYIEGGELGGLVREWHSEGGGPSPEQAAKVVLRIAEVVAFAHALDPPIVHRDLKPANILVQPRDDGGVTFKVADFGIGGVAAQRLVLETMAGRTKPQEARGNTLHGSHTPLYASPEQALGRPPDPRDDVHALGVIWYQLLTGDMSKGSPRGRKWVRRLMDDLGVPKAHLEIMEECFEEEAEDRLEDAGALVVKIKGVLADVAKAGAPTPADKETVKTKPGAPANRSGVLPASGTKAQPFENSLGMRFVPVPITGGPTGGKRVLFSVWQTRVQDYAAYAAENPGVDMGWEDLEYEGHKQGPVHPVVHVSWDDAQAFCAWLTEKEHAAGRIGAGDVYRLPTDHEWSCAVGIGDREEPSRTAAEKNWEIKTYPWGDGWPPPEGAGNYGDIILTEGFGPLSFGRKVRKGHGFTMAVGSFSPSKDGLYDLGGNVWEWCEDWYDPAEEVKSKKYHVLRGGSWDSYAEFFLRSSRRDINTPTNRYDNYGFRCVVEVGGVGP